MNISGIRPSIGFYDQNSIRIRQELGALPVEEPVEVAPNTDATSSVTEEEIASARKGQTFGAYDFASQYKPGEVHELKGADSDINSLDVKKAVIDMEKDSVIHRYQYFVKGKANQESQAQDIRGIEDFSL